MELIETGKIVGTHGIGGEIKIQPWTDTLETMLDFDYIYIDSRRFEIEEAKIQKNSILLKLAGIDNLNKAELLRNKLVYIDKSFFKLPEGTYFIQDLISLKVEDADSGTDYGTITDIFQTGANDVYEITDKNGKTRLIPAIKEVIVSTDIEKKIMTIRPLPGLFDEDSAEEKSENGK